MHRRGLHRRRRAAARRRPDLDGARDDDHRPGRPNPTGAARRRPSRFTAPTATTRHPADRRWSSSAASTRCRIRRRSRSEPDPEPPDPSEPPDIAEPLEGEGWIECISPVHYHGLEPGAHHFEVRAIDQADNVGPDAGDLRLDDRPHLAEDEATGPGPIAPDTRIASRPADPDDQHDGDLPLRRQRQRDAGPEPRPSSAGSTAREPFAPCTTPDRPTPASSRRHAHLRGARDRPARATSTRRRRPTPGRSSAPPADTTPPETTLDSGPDPVTVQHRARRSPSPATTRRATFECSLDGGADVRRRAPRRRTYTGLRRRRAHVPGPRDRPGRQRRPDAGRPTPGRSAPRPVPDHVFCGQVMTQSTLVTQRPDRLPLGRPRRRRPRHHDRPRTATRSTARASAPASATTATTTSRSGTARSRSSTTASCSTSAPSGNIVEALTLESNQEAGIALGHVPPARLDPTLPRPAEPPPTFQSEVIGNTLRNNTILANDQRHLADQRHAGHRDPRQRHRRQRQRGRSGSSARTATASRPTRSAAPSGAGVALEGSSDNTVVGNTLTENGGGVLARRHRQRRRSGLPSNDNLVEGNTIAESGGAGIEVGLSSSDGNQLHRQRRPLLQRRRHLARLRARHARARQRRARQQGRHRR